MNKGGEDREGKNHRDSADLRQWQLLDWGTFTGPNQVLLIWVMAKCFDIFGEGLGSETELIPGA